MFAVPRSPEPVDETKSTLSYLTIVPNWFNCTGLIPSTEYPLPPLVNVTVPIAVST